MLVDLATIFLNLGIAVTIAALVYLGFNSGPWWAPLMAGLAMAAFCFFQPRKIYALQEILYYERPLVGFSFVIGSTYMMYTVIGIVFFGIGWIAKMVMG